MTDPSSPEAARIVALESALNRLRVDLMGQKDHNSRLIDTLKEARAQIITLKSEIDRLAQPPAGFATFISPVGENSADVLSAGRKMQVPVSPGIAVADLVAGQEVMLSDAMSIIGVRQFEDVGEIVIFKEILDSGTRALVVGNSDDERVIRLAMPLQAEKLRAGDSLLLDTRSGYAT
ncbi:MAG: proteasome ATPase, partial [Actinobacteria bacterium]|nr:proteasome ATPase [Actinomycetota bacterium]